MPKRRVVAAAVALALGFPTLDTLAQSIAPTTLPTGGRVVAGQATIGQNGAAMQIQQGSARAALDWASFSIGSQAAVTFNQPSASAIALNRVLGTSGSEIYGRLSANGQVFLINPNGVLFARGSQVDVGGIVASTLSMSSDDFMAGRYQLRNGGSAASVINQGDIKGRSVVLVGPRVVNDGTIEAQAGTIALTAANAATLDLMADGLVQIRVDQGAVAAEVANSGLLRADGGTVTLTAKSLDNLARSVVNHSGIIEARGVQNVGGVVRLLGDHVGLTDAARIDVSGATGGGQVLIGGNYQGKGPEQNAIATYVGRDVTIDASAGTLGDGGKVVVWADQATRFYGSIKATGGAQGGDGGFVEISGKQWLDFQGRVDTRAVLGRTGTLLLDPTDITISAATTSNGTCILSLCFTLVGLVNAATLNVADLTSALGTSNVAVSTSSLAGGNGDIRVDTPVSWASANSLSLVGDRDVRLSSAVINTGTGAINLSAGRELRVDANLSSGGAVNVTAQDARFTSGTANLNGTYNVSGTTTVSGASANFTGTLTSLGALDVSSGTANLGTTSVTVPTLRQSGGTITGSGNLTVSGATTLSGGTMSGPGSTITVGALTINLNGTTLDAGRVLDVHGGATWSAGDIRLNSSALPGSGQIINRAGSTFLTTFNGSISASNFGGSDNGATALFDNQGTFHKKTGPLGTTSISTAFNNSGSVDTQNGTLNLSGGGTHSGSFSGAATIQFGGGTHALTATGSVTTGNATFSAGTVDVGGTYNVGGTTTVNGGSANFTGTLTSLGATLNVTAGTADIGTANATVSSFTQSDGTLSGSGSVTVTNSYLQSGGVMNIGGAALITQAAGALNLGAITARSIKAAASAGDVLVNGALVATGPVSIRATGGIDVKAPIQTSDATANAMVLSSAGGEVTLASAGALSVGSGGRATIFTGTIAASTGVAATVGLGSGNFRYNSDGSSIRYTAPLGSGIYAIYREQPTLTITADNKGPVPYGSALPPYASSVGGLQNGDTALLALLTPATVTDDGIVSTSGNLTAGSHVLTPGGAVDRLGYALAYGAGALTIAPASISSVSGLAANTKVYDGTVAATVDTTGALFAGKVAGDVLTVGSASAVFNNRHVGTGKPVSVTAMALGGADAGNYTLASSTASTAGVITARPITVRAQTGTRVYDGTTSSAVTPVITSGSLAGSDAAGFTQSYDTKNVGTGKTLTAGGSVNDGNSGANYSVTYVTDTAGVITARPITVRAQTGTRVYDGTTSSAVTPVITWGSLAGSDAAGFTQSYDTKNVGTGKTLTASGSVNDGNSGANYSVTYVTDTTGAITPRSLVVTAQPSTKVYDGNTSSTGAPSVSGLVGGDTAAFATQTYDTKDVGTVKTLTPGAGTVSDGNGGNNYVVTRVSGNTGVITQLSSVSWSGSGGDDLWSNPLNWAGNAIPDKANVANVDLAGAAVVFDAAVRSISNQVSVSKVTGGTLAANGGPLTLAVASDVTLSGYSQASGITSIGGNLSITSAETSVIQTGGTLIVAGSTFINAASNSVALPSPTNNFGGPVTASAMGGISILAGGVLTPGTIDAGTGSVALTAPSLGAGGPIIAKDATLSSDTSVSGLQMAVTDSLVLNGAAQSWRLLTSVAPAGFTTLQFASLFENGVCITGPLCGASVETVTGGFRPAAIISSLPTNTTTYLPAPLPDSNVAASASIAPYQVASTASTPPPAQSGIPRFPLTPAMQLLLDDMEQVRQRKKLALGNAVSILERDPTVADLKPCASASDELSGNCIAQRPKQPLTRAGAARQAPAEAALPAIQRKVALLIGEAAYMGSIPKLNSPVKDIQEIAKLYREQFGYEVRMLPNADKTTIVRELNRLILETGPDDSVTVFYAGHGQLIEKTGRGYWIPSKASADNPAEWISNSDIGRTLEAIAAKQVLLVSDSCYSGTLTREAKVEKSEILSDPAAVLARRAVTVLSSGGEEPVADAGKDGHSVFAWHFMRSLQTVKEWSGGLNVYEQLADAVQQDFPQEPRYGAATAAGHQRGADFLFEVRKY